MILKKKLAVLGLAAVMTVAFMPAMAFAETNANTTTPSTTTAGTTTPTNSTQTANTIPSKITKEGTYTLPSDLTQSITIKTGVTATLDLNGKTLTNTANQDTITVEKGATLTITDSSTGAKGTIDNISNQKAPITNNGNVTIQNGVNITRSRETGISPTQPGNNTWYNIVNKGSMSIIDAHVSQTGAFTSLIQNVQPDDSSTATLEISGGSFSGGVNTIKNDDGGVLTITGGTFTNKTQFVVQNWNKATISGGNYSNESNNSVIGNGTWGKADIGELTISGGTYSGSSLLNENGQSQGTGTVSVTDGDFTAITKGAANDNSPYKTEKFISGGTFGVNPSTNLKDNAAAATVTNGSTTTYAVGEKDIQKAAEDSSNTVTITKGSVSLTGANAKIVNDATNKDGRVTVDGTTVNAGGSVQPNAAQTIANLKNEIASLKSQLAQAQASASGAQNTANDSARQITQLKKDLADAQAQLKTAQAQAASQGSTLTAPGQVMNLKVKAGKKSAKLSWTALTDNTTGYRVYRKTKGGKYAKVKTITKASTASWTNKGLKKGKTYYYKVRAYKSITSGELWGAYSNTAKAKVK